MSSPNGASVADKLDEAGILGLLLNSAESQTGDGLDSPEGGPDPGSLARVSSPPVSTKGMQTAELGPN